MLSDRTHIISNYNQNLSSYTFKFMIKKVLSKRSTFSYGIIEFEYCQYICKYFNKNISKLQNSNNFIKKEILQKVSLLFLKT